MREHSKFTALFHSVFFFCCFEKLNGAELRLTVSYAKLKGVDLPLA